MHQSPQHVGGRDIRPSIRVRDLSKAYGDTPAITGVSLDVYPAEIVAILGPNGSGKTTFVKILATSLRKDAGTVHILGRDLDKEERHIRHLFGYVGQDTERSAYARLTVRENLQFFGSLHGLIPSQIAARTNTLAQRFGFAAKLDSLFMTLSGGQKQTMVIMRALLHDPRVLYLDEPTKGLDPVVAAEIRGFLKEWVRDNDTSVLLTSHILSEVDDLADRVALLRSGALTVAGSPTDLKHAVGFQGLLEIPASALTPSLETTLARSGAVVRQANRGTQWITFGVTGRDPMALETVLGVLRREAPEVGFRYRPVSLEDAYIHHLGPVGQQW